LEGRERGFERILSMVREVRGMGMEGELMRFIGAVSAHHIANAPITSVLLLIVLVVVVVLLLLPQSAQPSACSHPTKPVV